MDLRNQIRDSPSTKYVVIFQQQQRRLNEESGEVSQVLNVGEVALSDCEEMRMTQTANVLSHQLNFLEKL